MRRSWPSALCRNCQQRARFMSSCLSITHSQAAIRSRWLCPFQARERRSAAREQYRSPLKRRSRQPPDALLPAPNPTYGKGNNHRPFSEIRRPDLRTSEGRQSPKLCLSERFDGIALQQIPQLRFSISISELIPRHYFKLIVQTHRPNSLLARQKSEGLQGQFGTWRQA